MGCLKLQDIQFEVPVLKLTYSSPVWSEPIFQDFLNLPNPGAPAHRFAFNGKEKDDETYGEGDEYDFGARIYDARVGRWMSCDPLMIQYPSISPYVYTGNNPIIYKDNNGKDFGVEFDFDNHTIIITANIYATSEKAYEQAIAAARLMNSQNANGNTANIDGNTFSVQFNIKVIKPKKMTDEEMDKALPESEKKTAGYKQYPKEWTQLYFDDQYSRQAEADPNGIGNVYYGTSGTDEINENKQSAVGGRTSEGKSVSMNVIKDKTINKSFDCGSYVKLVAHEFCHLLGLDDEWEKTADGQKANPYYCNGGIMQYTGSTSNDLKMNGIATCDIKFILKYAVEYYQGKAVPRANKERRPSVKVKEISKDGKTIKNSNSNNIDVTK